MKILKWEFTRENAYALSDTVLKFIAPSGLLGTILAMPFVDLATAAKVAGIIAFLNTMLRAVELLLKPVPTTPPITY